MADISITSSRGKKENIIPQASTGTSMFYTKKKNTFYSNCQVALAFNFSINRHLSY